jgi:23S rRNA (cytidine1920-2'-O)/16S rRNA (cytidine1409-2'-O)-methyltransferase
VREGTLTPMRKSRTRLDALLVERGLYPSRSRAAAAVMAGEVRLGEERAGKPGQLVTLDACVEVTQAPRFVSRGGIKLSNALQAFGLDPTGRLCLDVGASTGGFTDCLLQAGAEEVVAVDVAYGALHWRLRNHPRVTVRERVNARTLEPAALPYRPDLIAVDVAFISLTKVLPAVLACAAREFDCLALVKPQFELGRERVGKGGVVRAPEDRRSALVVVAESVIALDRSVLGFASSGLPGPAGNLESFVWIAPSGDRRAIGDLEAAARSVEP